MRPLAIPIAVSAGVVLSAPFMGQLRAALRLAFPDQFVAIVGLVVAAAVAVALVLAARFIRDRRLPRYAAIAAAIGLGVGYSLLTASGTPEVDVVERVHFVEYGVITFLFYRVWRPTGDSTVFILPVLAGLVVGACEEWLQWFIPNRVGEIRDVFLNLVAMVCGLLFSLGVLPPAGFSRRLREGSRRRLVLAASAAVLVCGAFVSAVHLGHLVEAADGSTFRSRYDAGELERLGRDRSDRWRVRPPIVLRRLSREDQYLDEGFWHVRRRNQAWAAGDYATAWGENRILERYFAPVLDTTTYAGPPSRWPAEQRADAEQRVDTSAPYQSDAEPFPILLWP